MNNRIIDTSRVIQDFARQKVKLGSHQFIVGMQSRIYQYDWQQSHKLWWKRPELLLEITVLALFAAIIGLILSHIEVGSGDYGQWLMLSRYYMGQDIPDYRHVLSIPPMMPLMLAAVRLFISDPIVALQVFKGLLAASLTISLYLAGTAIFRVRGAGILSVVCGLLITERVLELFTFGGLAQLCSLIFMCLGIAAFAQAGNCADLRMRWWVLGSLGILMAVLSHVGTGLIAIVVCMPIALVSVLRIKSLTRTSRRLAITPLVVTLFGLAIYLIVIILPLNQEYAQNPASLTYRGPGRIWEMLTLYPPNTILLIISASLIIGGITYEVLSRRIYGFIITGAWALTTWAIVAFSVIAGVATDYPRFIAPIMVPMAITAGGGMALISGSSTRLFHEKFQRPARVVLPLTLAAVLALSLGILTVSKHNDESSFYKTSNLTDLKAAADWLEAGSYQDMTILSTAREGKWIEGFTGLESLFSIPTRFSFRLGERARSIAAETLLRSTTSLTNEFFFIKYVDGKTGSTGYVPRYPWIGVNHGGEYLDLVRILPTESRVIAGDTSGGVLATINSLKAVGTDVVNNDDSIEFCTSWEGDRGGSVSYTRTVSIDKGIASFDLVDEVITTMPLKEIQVEIRPVPGMEITAVEIGDNYADLYFPKYGDSEPHLRVSGVGQKVVFEEIDGRIIARSQLPSRLHLQFTVMDPGEPIFELGMFTPEQLIETYNVGAVVLKESSALEARIARLEKLGFVQKELDLGPYVIMVPSTDTAGEV